MKRQYSEYNNSSVLADLVKNGHPNNFAKLQRKIVHAALYDKPGQRTKTSKQLAKALFFFG